MKKYLAAILVLTAAKRFFTAFFLCSLANSVVASADELVSFELVRQPSGEVEMRQSYEGSTSVRTGDRLELVSDFGTDFGLKVMRSVHSELGNRVITATTDAGGTAVLVVGRGGKLFGSITELGERHQIFTAADGKRQIIKEGRSGYEKRIDDGGLSPRVEILTPNIELQLDESEVNPSPYRMMKAERSSNVIYPAYKTGTAKIAVLMYYDDSMSDALSTADFISQLANDAYADSRTAIEIDIVGMKAVDVDDEASHGNLYDAMYAAEAPFEDITEDRRIFSADLVILLRATEAPNGEDPCGLGGYGVYAGSHSRNRYVGLVQWKPNTGQGSYCPELAFAHEIGHLLGGAHNREDRNKEGDEPRGAYSYSHGSTVLGSHTTVMGVDRDGPTPRLGLFSSPNLSCNGYACGKPASSTNSANNVSTFQSTGHLIASNEGEFAFEAVSAYAVREGASECTTTNGEAGYWTGAGIRNQSSFSVELVSQHFRRTDGSLKVYEYDAGERVAQSGSRMGGGFCRAEGESPVFGTTFTEVFMRYKHPETGAIVETETHEAVDNYDGEYRKVRVASGGGGSVSGNPTQVVRVGASQTFTFMPDAGYDVASIKSNCSGWQSGNNYTVDVSQDDCFVGVAFERTFVDGILPEIQITEAYIGLFGRAPDPKGLAYWENQLTTDIAAGQDPVLALKKLTNDMTLNSGFTLKTDTEVNARTAVDAMYVNLFARNASVEEQTYWAKSLFGDDATSSASELVVLLVQGAKAPTAANTAGAEILDLKVQAATYYVENVTDAQFRGDKATATNAVRDVNDAGSLADSKTATDVFAK